MNKTLPISGSEVINFIPQKPPMSMIDTICEVNTLSAITKLKVLENNVFYNNGALQAPGLTENIAQTVAAHAGFLAAQKNEAPPIGFIGAIKNLKIHYLPQNNETLTTEISIEHEVMNFTMINGVSKVGNTIAAECQMKIFVADKK